MRRLSSESGAVLMNVILAMVLLIGINTFVIDYGVMWVGRGQAQNAADAGALAGAVAMAFDDYNDRLDTGPAKRSAYETSQQNFIWGEAPAVNITNDVTFPTVPANPCADNSCIRVDVYRNVAKGNPLPALFGTAIGLTSQGVRAMAIARAGAANASDCLKPFAIPDKWLDRYDETPTIDVDTWTADDTFDLVYPKGSKVGKAGDPIAAPNLSDLYVAPSKSSTGTGFTLANDLGTKVVLKYGNPNDSPSPGNFLPIDLPLASGGVSSGGNDYSNNIANCNGAPVAIGDTLTTEPGNMVGPTKAGMDALIAKDPNAQWDSTNKAVINSCAQASPSCGKASPRIVAIPVFNTSIYETDRLNGKSDVVITNILGFFVESQSNKGDITGYFTTIPGLLVNGPSVGIESGFAKVVTLVR